MDNAPITAFKDSEELTQRLRYWQEALFLHDWIIDTRTVHRDEMSDPDFIGENRFNILHKISDIKIIVPDEWNREPLKYCAEHILVHELLHCKYDWLNLEDNAEGHFMDEMLHQKLEEMARSLIMVKYGVGPEWFRIKKEPR